MAGTARLAIRDVAPADLVALQAINEAAVPEVNSVSVATLERFTREAVHFRVATLAGGLAGFLVAFAEGAPYESPNYRWFATRYPVFVYIDRVAVAADYRRRGVGGALYADVAAFAASRAPLLACEVNLRPRNRISLQFHAHRGFRQVASQNTERGTKTVALMTRRLV